jgi:hypothetical protein
MPKRLSKYPKSKLSLSKILANSSPTIDLLYPLWVGLTSIIWLQALFLLSTAFLHFYLFFILHIPFDHLTSNKEEEEEGRERVEGIQREVDIRARCERPPFEEYIWVWWAWWAMRRGPVGHIYGIVTGSLSIVCVSVPNIDLEVTDE